MPNRTIHRRTARLPLAVALSAGSILASGVQAGGDAPTRQDLRTRVAARDAQGNQVDLDIRRITLYRSGVGYFERHGSIRGDQTVELRFEADQINDILKSMVLLDLDPDAGGSIETISYGSKEPLDRRLASYDIDISGAPDIAGLFKQLRGEEIRVTTNQGVTRGTILGIEARKDPAPRDSVEGPITRTYVNLVTTSGIQSMAIDSILSFDFEDENLGAQLQRALTALAEHRTDRLKTVDLVFRGPEDRARRVLLSYVHETPVWKTSYRLVLPDDESDPVTLQGWAIVENTTDHDWENVQLSLASGRPVSFTMDLYEPIYAPRPELPVPVAAALAGRTYTSGRGDYAKLEALRQGGQGGARAEGEARARRANEMAEIVADQAMLSAPGAAPMDFDAGAIDDAFGGMAGGGGAAASGGEVGEQFMYTLEMPVTIERQRSAMLPIITSPVAGRRVSTYNASDISAHPMRGVQIANNSGLHLMPGPIAVYDGSAYAGDSRVPHTSRGQNRLLSYALDLDVRASVDRSNQNRIVRLKIVNGLIEQTLKNISTTTYRFDNHDSSRGRTLLVEHAKISGWDLVAPDEPEETTDDVYRFELDLAKSDQADLEVVQENVSFQRVGVTSIPLETLVGYASDGRLSEAALEAIRHAAALQAKINRLRDQVTALDRETQAITDDQNRIRNNMGRIDRNSELFGRYMAKLNVQEDRLEQILVERERTEAQRLEAQRELDGFLSDLDVD